MGLLTEAHSSPGMKKRGERKMGERQREGDGRKAKMEWSPIKPKSNLNITRLKDTDLFTVQNFFTSVESKAFIKAAESIGFVHQGSLGPTKGEAYRDNDRISVNDPVLAVADKTVTRWFALKLHVFFLVLPSWIWFIFTLIWTVDEEMRFGVVTKTNDIVASIHFIRTEQIPNES